jgi:hypothetical protein
MVNRQRMAFFPPISFMAYRQTLDKNFARGHLTAAFIIIVLLIYSHVYSTVCWSDFGDGGLVVKENIYGTQQPIGKR